MRKLLHAGKYVTMGIQGSGKGTEALAVRLREYHEKTNPVLEIFRRKEYVITVDTRAAKEQVQQSIRDKLGISAPRLAATPAARADEHGPPR